MKFATVTKGYSLVEVMVAISILMISIIGPMTIAVKSYQSAQYSRQQNTAFFLAQEGITAVNTLRNNGGVDAYTNASVDPWDWTTNPNIDECYEATGCNIDFRDSSLLDNITDCSVAGACRLLFDADGARARYQTNAGEESPYTRVITIELISAEEMQVESVVSWESKLLNSSQEVRLSTSLFNLYKQ